MCCISSLICAHGAVLLEIRLFFSSSFSAFFNSLLAIAHCVAFFRSLLIELVFLSVCLCVDFVVSYVATLMIWFVSFFNLSLTSGTCPKFPFANDVVVFFASNSLKSFKKHQKITQTQRGLLAHSNWKKKHFLSHSALASPHVLIPEMKGPCVFACLLPFSFNTFVRCNFFSFALFPIRFTIKIIISPSRIVAGWNLVFANRFWKKIKKLLILNDMFCVKYI